MYIEAFVALVTLFFLFTSLIGSFVYKYYDRNGLWKKIIVEKTCQNLRKSYKEKFKRKWGFKFRSLNYKQRTQPSVNSVYLYKTKYKYANVQVPRKTKKQTRFTGRSPRWDRYVMRKFGLQRVRRYPPGSSFNICQSKPRTPLGTHFNSYFFKPTKSPNMDYVDYYHRLMRFLINAIYKTCHCDMPLFSLVPPSGTEDLNYFPRVVPHYLDELNNIDYKEDDRSNNPDIPPTLYYSDIHKKNKQSLNKCVEKIKGNKHCTGPPRPLEPVKNDDITLYFDDIFLEKAEMDINVAVYGNQPRHPLPYGHPSEWPDDYYPVNSDDDSISRISTIELDMEYDYMIRNYGNNIFNIYNGLNYERNAKGNAPRFTAGQEANDSGDKDDKVERVGFTLLRDELPFYGAPTKLNMIHRIPFYKQFAKPLNYDIPFNLNPDDKDGETNNMETSNEGPDLFRTLKDRVIKRLEGGPPPIPKTHAPKFNDNRSMQMLFTPPAVDPKMTKKGKIEMAAKPAPDQLITFDETTSFKMFLDNLRTESYFRETYLDQLIAAKIKSKQKAREHLRFKTSRFTKKNLEVIQTYRAMKAVKKKPEVAIFRKYRKLLRNHTFTGFMTTIHRIHRFHEYIKEGKRLKMKKITKRGIRRTNRIRRLRMRRKFMEMQRENDTNLKPFKEVMNLEKKKGRYMKQRLPNPETLKRGYAKWFKHFETVFSKAGQGSDRRTTNESVEDGPKRLDETEPEKTPSKKSKRSQKEGSKKDEGLEGCTPRTSKKSGKSLKRKKSSRKSKKSQKSKKLSRKSKKSSRKSKKMLKGSKDKSGKVKSSKSKSKKKKKKEGDYDTEVTARSSMRSSKSFKKSKKSKKSQRSNKESKDSSRKSKRKSKRSKRSKRSRKSTKESKESNGPTVLPRKKGGMDQEDDGGGDEDNVDPNATTQGGTIEVSGDLPLDFKRVRVRGIRMLPLRYRNQLRVKRKFWLRTGKASIFNKFENEKRKALVSRNLTLLQQYHEALRRYEDGNYLREPKFDIDDEIQMNDAVKKIQGYIFILRRLQKTPKNTQKRWKGKVVPWKDQWRAELRKRKIFEARSFPSSKFLTRNRAQLLADHDFKQQRALVAGKHRQKLLQMWHRSFDVAEGVVGPPGTNPGLAYQKFKKVKQIYQQIQKEERAKEDAQMKKGGKMRNNVQSFAEQGDTRKGEIYNTSNYSSMTYSTKNEKVERLDYIEEDKPERAATGGSTTKLPPKKKKKYYRDPIENERHVPGVERIFKRRLIIPTNKKDLQVDKNKQKIKNARLAGRKEYLAFQIHLYTMQVKKEQQRYALHRRQRRFRRRKRIVERVRRRRQRRIMRIKMLSRLLTQMDQRLTELKEVMPLNVPKVNEPKERVPKKRLKIKLQKLVPERKPCNDEWAVQRWNNRKQRMKKFKKLFIKAGAWYMYKLKNRKKYIAHYSKEKRLASLALYQLSRLRQAYKLAQSFWGPDIRPGETKPVNEKRRKDYITQQVLQTLKEYRMGNPNKKRRIVARKAKLMREGLTPDGEALNVVSNDNSQKKDFEPHRKAVIEQREIRDFFIKPNRSKEKDLVWIYLHKTPRNYICPTKAMAELHLTKAQQQRLRRNVVKNRIRRSERNFKFLWKLRQMVRANKYMENSRLMLDIMAPRGEESYNFKDQFRSHKLRKDQHVAKKLLEHKIEFASQRYRAWRLKKRVDIQRKFEALNEKVEATLQTAELAKKDGAIDGKLAVKPLYNKAMKFFESEKIILHNWEEKETAQEVLGNEYYNFLLDVNKRLNPAVISVQRELPEDENLLYSVFSEFSEYRKIDLISFRDKFERAGCGMDTNFSFPTTTVPDSVGRTVSNTNNVEPNPEDEDFFPPNDVYSFGERSDTSGTITGLDTLEGSEFEDDESDVEEKVPERKPTGGDISRMNPIPEQNSWVPPNFGLTYQPHIQMSNKWILFDELHADPNLPNYSTDDSEIRSSDALDWSTITSTSEPELFIVSDDKKEVQPQKKEPKEKEKIDMKWIEEIKNPVAKKAVKKHLRQLKKHKKRRRKRRRAIKSRKRHKKLLRLMSEKKVKLNLARYNANVESKHPSETSTDYSNSVPVSKHVDIFEPSFGTMGNTKVERMAKRLKLSERMTKTLEDVHKHYRLKGIARFLPEKDTKHIKTVVDDYKDEEAHQMWLDYRRQKLASLAESMEYNQKMNWDVMPEYTKRKNPKKKKLKKKKNGKPTSHAQVSTSLLVSPSSLRDYHLPSPP